MHEMESPTEKQMLSSNIFHLFEIMSLTLEQLTKLTGTFISPSPELSKCFFTVWMHLIFKQVFFEGNSNSKACLKRFAFFSPNLVEVSQKSFSNQILINDLVTNAKIIEKNKRNFKHVLRNLYPEQRSIEIIFFNSY